MQDVLVIGAGIFGLTLARKLRRARRDVLIAEARAAGAGASATPLGVLAPHAPDNWNPKKEAQFRALVSLPAYLAALEEETGHRIAYRRRGRLVPLTTANQHAAWARRVADARENWRGEAGLSLLERADPDWIAPEAAPFGAALCGLSATVDARAYVAALAASVGDALHTGLTLDRLEPGAAVFATGERIVARLIVLATGAAAFAHLPPAAEGDPAGRGEKGQAAVLRVGRAVADRPLIYHDGTYVVPRGAGQVAVGATSERHFEVDDAVDGLLEERLDRARAICPALAEGAVVERWASVRPRSADRGLTVGTHPSLAGVAVATGGFKTGLAMAHTLDPETLT